MRASMVAVLLVMVMGLSIGFADGASSATSGTVSIDTRSISSLVNGTDEAVDTRTFTEAWSAVRKINTNKFTGTMIFIR